jgi:cell division protein FtsB
MGLFITISTFDFHDGDRIDTAYDNRKLSNHLSNDAAGAAQQRARSPHSKETTELFKRTLTIYLPILIVSAMFLMIIFGGKGLMDLKTMRLNKERIIQRNEALVEKNLSLHQTVVRLKDDPVFIEHVAREDLGLIKSDEIIMKLERQAVKGTPHD